LDRVLSSARKQRAREREIAAEVGTVIIEKDFVGEMVLARERGEIWAFDSIELVTLMSRLGLKRLFSGKSKESGLGELWDSSGWHD